MPWLKGLPNRVKAGLLFYCPLLGTFLPRGEAGGFEVVFHIGAPKFDRGLQLRCENQRRSRNTYSNAEASRASGRSETDLDGPSPRGRAPLPLSNLSQRRAALIPLAAAARARAHGCGLGCFCCLEVGINRQPHNEGPSDALSSSNCSPLKRKCTPRCLLKKTMQLGK